MNILLHIGAFKTGTTSFQFYLQKNRKQLHLYGFDVYQSLLGIENHYEIPNAIIRRDRDTFGRLRGLVSTNDSYIRKTYEYLHKYMLNSKCDNLIISSEALSLVRYDDELEALSGLLGPGHTVKIFFMRRNQWDFLDAYRRQLYKNPNRKSSQNPDSCCYIEADSWVADHDRVVTLYKNHFGNSNISVLDYDYIMAEDCDILPHLATSMKIPFSLLPKTNSYRKNVSTGAGPYGARDPADEPLPKRALAAMRILAGRSTINFAKRTIFARTRQASS